MYFQKTMERVFIFLCQNLWTWLVYQFDLRRKMKCWLFLDCLGLQWAFMSYVFKISWCIMWPLTFHVTQSLQFLVDKGNFLRNSYCSFCDLLILISFKNLLLPLRPSITGCFDTFVHPGSHTDSIDIQMCIYSFLVQQCLYQILTFVFSSIKT